MAIQAYFCSTAENNNANNMLVGDVDGVNTDYVLTATPDSWSLQIQVNGNPTHSITNPPVKQAMRHPCTSISQVISGSNNIPENTHLKLIAKPLFLTNQFVIALSMGKANAVFIPVPTITPQMM